MAGILGGAAPAHGAEDPVRAGTGEQRTPPTEDSPPAGWRLSAQQATARASAHPEVRATLAANPDFFSRAYLKADRHWQVSYLAPPDPAGEGRREVAVVLLRDADGAIVEAWTGFRVDWTMARGYPGAFGRAVNSPWIWLGLCGLFALPFLRRPLRLLHADLAALLGLSVSYALFTSGAIEASVPLAVPPLAYLLARMLAMAWRRAGGHAPAHRSPLVLTLSTRALGVGVVVLIALRLVLNVTTSTVIDVGYAGVIGADSLLSGHGVYGTFPLDNPRGDTYGPVTYYAYVPWELLLPWRGTLDALPAAHAAAASFDLAAIAVLWRLGRVLRGPRLGALLAYLWCAFPFTLLTLNTNTNDALTAALVGLVLLFIASPGRRGAAVALAGLAKFAPLALGPLAATHPGGVRPGDFGRVTASRAALRRVGITALTFALASCVLLLPVLVLDGPGRVLERTLGFQSGRDSPFSPWGLYDLPTGQLVAAAAAIGLALVAAVLPRRRDVVVTCALAAGVLIGIQLALGHWFYTYVVWFLPPLWVALLAPYEEPVAAARRGGPAAGLRRPGAARTRSSRRAGANPPG